MALSKLSILLTIICTILIGCSELDRSNPLDPKNPDSQRPRVVVVEAFVSDDPNAVYCPFTLQGLAQLEAEVGTAQLLILEYHLQKTGEWDDDYALQTANLRYNELATTQKGVPDVFFCGPHKRLQGASSVEAAYERYRPAFEEESALYGIFTIELTTSESANEVNIFAKIARLGNSSESDIVVRGVVVRDFGDALHRHVVVASPLSQPINQIDAGEIAEVSFSVSQNDIAQNNTKFVVFIQKQTGAEVILQAASIIL